MNLNISTSKIQNNKNFATSIQPYCSGNCQKSHDSSAQKQLIASCMRADIIEPSFNNYSNNKTYSNATHNKKIATNVVVKSKKPIHQSKQIHSSYSANVQNSGNGTNPVNSTFYKHLNLKKYSNSTRKKQVTTARSAAVQSTLCKGTNTVDAIFNKHSNPAKYSNVVNTQMITHGLRRSLKKPILCQSRVKEIHTSNSVAIPNVTCNKSNIIEPTFNKHSNPKTHSDIILNEQLTTNLPFIPKESISSSQHAKQIHLTNSDAIQNESSCSKTVYVKGFSFPKVLEAKSILYNSDKIKTNESNQTKLSSSSLNSLQTSDIITSISRICTTSGIPDDSESNSGLFKRQATRVSDSNLKCPIPSLKENNTKADSVPNSSNVPQVQDDFIKPNNSYETVQGDKMQITNASQTNLKCIKPCLKGNKNTDTILNISNEPKFIDEFIKSNNLCQNLVGINKDSQKDKRQIDNPSQTNLKFTKLSAEQNNTKTNAAPNIKSVPQVEDDFINPNNSCQTIASNSKQKISLDDTNISKKVLFPKKSISSYESNLTNSSCSSSSKIASLDKSLGNSLKTSKFLERNHQFQNRPNIEETKRCSSESVSLPMLHTPIIHLPENTKNTLTIIPLDDMKAKDEKDNTLKSVSLSPSSQTSPVSLQITLKKHAVEEHSSTKGRDSITDIIVCQNSINDSVKTSKNISCLNSSISPVVLNFDKQPELYEKISKYDSSAVVERKPAEPEVSDNTPLFHTNKPQKIIRQNIVYTDDRETILRLLTLNEHEDDSETKKNALKNVKHSEISTFCDNESFVIPENMKKSNISSEFTIKLQDVGNKVRCWPKPVITLETIAFNKHNVSLSELVTKENYPSGSKNEPLNKSIIAEIADRTKKIPLSQNLKEISEKISSDYEILTNVSNAFDTQNSDKNNCSVNLNHTSQSNSKSINVKAYSPSPVSTANMTKNIVSCPEKTQTIKNNSEKLPPSLLISPQKNGISLNSLQKCDALVTNVGNESKDNSEILNISPNISQNNFKNQEFSVKDNHAKANEVYQEKNVSQIEINCIESNNLSQAQRINQIFTGIPHKRKIPVLDADANIPNKAVCVRNSSSSSESVLLNSNCNSITKFTSIDKAVEEFQNKNYDKNVRSPTRSLLFQNKNKVEEMKEWAFKSVPPTALLHTKDVLPVKNSQESVSCTSVQNIIAINRKFDILKRYWLSKSENQVFSSCLPSMNTMNSPEIKAEDSIATSNVTFDVSGTSDNMPSLDPPLLTTVMNTVNDYGLPKKVHKKDSSTLIEMEPSLPKMPCNLSLAGSFCDPKCHAENMEARLTSAKQIGISPYCQIQSLVIPEKNEDMSLEITIKIKDVNKKIGLLERTGVFNGRVIADSYLSKPFAEKIDFTTTSKSEPLVKVEILNEKVKEKCFSSPHNLKEMPKSPPCCINNEVTSLDCVNDRNEIVNSKPTENIPPISENILNDTRFVKTIQANVANFGTFKTNKIFDDFNKSEALETVKSSQASTTSNDGMINNVSVTENKNFEIHGISVGSCQTSSKTKSEIYSDHSFHENTHDEADKNKISCDLSRVSGNVQGADFISNNTFMPLSGLEKEPLENTTLLHTENKSVGSSADNTHKTISSENELCNVNSEENLDLQLLRLLLTEVQNTYGKVFLKNYIKNCVKSSGRDSKDDIDKSDKSSYTSDVGEQKTLNQKLVLQDKVTSPKLSLKRNRTELTPDRKLDERSGVENVSKKIKFDEGVLGTELSNKMAETSISTDTTSKVSVNTVPSTSFASTVPVIEVSDEEPFLIPDEDAEFQMISSMNSDAPTCNIPEERKKKLKRILDFAGPLMPPDTSDQEKKIIAERLMKQLDTAQQSYVESENFNFLLDHSFEKIKMKPHSVFTFLNEIKRELKKHKKENKKAIKGSAEDNRVSLTDDSISKDILFIDSSSSLPSKDKVALSDALHTSLNFTSSLKDFFKVPEKQEPDSASCSSELTNFFSTNKNINDSGSNLQTAANSNTKVVSDNHVTSESSSSVIALEEYSEKSNASKSQSLYTQMSKKFKSAEDNTSFLSNTAISESTSIPVSGNDSEKKKVDLLSQQSNRHTSIDDSRSNLQTCANSDKKLVYDHFVKNDFSSSAIASAVGLCSKELKTSKLPSLKEPLIEKLNSTGVAHNVSTSIPERGVSRNNVNREFDLTSLPSTSRCHSPSDKFLFKNDISFKMSRSSSSDSLSADTRTLLEKRDDDRNAKRIKKLEKLLKELDKAIKRCQQQELTLDDMDKADSAYLQESRYKKRFVATYKLLCKLKRVPARTGRIIEKKFRYQGSRYTVINKAIEKLIDSKKIHEKFPDYSEVFNVIKQVQDRDDLGFNEIDISNEAKRVFEDIGEQLKERRYRDQRELVGCYLTDNLDLDEDPAERDDRLKKTLDENSKKFNASINQIIDHFVEKQQQTPAGENDDEEDDGEDDDEKDDDEKEEDEEEIVANIQDDSDDLPGTAPASPENIGGAPVVNIIERDDDDIVIINYSDKSTDPEEDNKEKQTFTVNKPNISQSVVLEDSSSGDLPSLQELVDKSKIDS